MKPLMNKKCNFFIYFRAFQVSRIESARNVGPRVGESVNSTLQDSMFLTNLDPLTWTSNPKVSVTRIMAQLRHNTLLINKFAQVIIFVISEVILIKG